MQDYMLESEVDSVNELILAGLFAMLGFGVLMLMILTFTSRLNEYERYDKVAANAQYEEAIDHTYKFTPYQAYMMGYNVDPWGPQDLTLTWWAGSQDKQHITLSVEAYGKDLIKRNNMISGANGVNPSVRSVIDSMNTGSDSSTATWYRSGNLHLNWTDSHSEYYNAVTEDNITWDHNRKDFKWILETDRQ